MPTPTRPRITLSLPPYLAAAYCRAYPSASLSTLLQSAVVAALLAGGHPVPPAPPGAARTRNATAARSAKRQRAATEIDAAPKTDA